MAQSNYPILSFLYHIYALDEIEEMSTNADAYCQKHALPKAARSIIKNVQQGGSPSKQQLEQFLTLMLDELQADPAVW